MLLASFGKGLRQGNSEIYSSNLIRCHVSIVNLKGREYEKCSYNTFVVYITGCFGTIDCFSIEQHAFYDILWMDRGG